ncbi:sigma-70 family RNA polymerase sigma factor [Virgibacillus necropolis]|uniref:sigma-70 family RNA polymerase sigma factor n=1 Tax=Virgibacillus necropolis TaxID=163877 RepID=UPI00384D3EAF
MTTPYTFEEIFQQNERRIHYQIHKLNLHDPHQEYFQEGLCAMWNAYETYNPDKGPLSTYFNYTIRNRLIDLLRKQSRFTEKIQTYLQKNTTEIAATPSSSLDNPTLLDNPLFCKQVKSQLTANQWKWLYYAVIEGMPLKDLAIQENTTVDTVKGWSKQVRKKLRNSEVREQILEALQE